MIFIFMILALLSPNDKNRLLDQDVQNVLEWEAEINIASTRYQVPQWIVAGVLFNESNFRAVKRGGQYGHGQISCRVWLPSLKKKNIAHKCSDLMKPYVAIHGVAFILSELTKQKKSKKNGRADWPSVLSYYRHGYGWSNPDMGYYRRVYFYGKNIRSFWKDRRIQWCVK